MIDTSRWLGGLHPSSFWRCLMPSEDQKCRTHPLHAWPVLSESGDRGFAWEDCWNYPQQGGFHGCDPLQTDQQNSISTSWCWCSFPNSVSFGISAQTGSVRLPVLVLGGSRKFRAGSGSSGVVVSEVRCDVWCGSPREGGAAMAWRGCAGIDPISGCITPDEKYLPGRGWLLGSFPDGCVDYKPGSIQAWYVVYFGSARDEMTQATLLLGGCYRCGLQRQPVLWRDFCGAELRALGGCSSSGRLPWLPPCLRRTVLLLATNGSLECAMGMGLSPNWAQMVLDHHRMTACQKSGNLIGWRVIGDANRLCPVQQLVAKFAGFELVSGGSGGFWGSWKLIGICWSLSHFPTTFAVGDNPVGLFIPSP